MGTEQKPGLTLIVADPEVDLPARFLRLARELPVRLRFAADLKQLAELVAREPPDAVVLAAALAEGGERLYRSLHRSGHPVRCFTTAGAALREVSADEPDRVTSPTLPEQLLRSLLDPTPRA